jgi:hypothetical protein
VACSLDSNYSYFIHVHMFWNSFINVHSTVERPLCVRVYVSSVLFWFPGKTLYASVTSPLLLLVRIIWFFQVTIKSAKSMEPFCVKW